MTESLSFFLKKKRHTLKDLSRYEETYLPQRRRTRVQSSANHFSIERRYQ
ncbi:MAG: hypothetical protein ACI8SA_000809 [Dokdonia sp.]|jgi:hypothetical protein